MPLLHTFLMLFKPARNLVLVFTLFSNVANAQDPDSFYIATLFNRGSEFIENHPDSANWLFEEAKKESVKRDFKPGLVMYLNHQAALQISNGHSEKAQLAYDQAIALAKKNNLGSEEGLTWMKKGALSQFMSEYAKAADHYLAAASLLVTNEDRKNVIGLYTNIITTLTSLTQQNQSLQKVLPALDNDNTNEKEIATLLSQNITTEQGLEFQDQTTVREISGSKTYVIFGGAKFIIGSFAILNQYSNYRSVRKIPDGIISRIPDIPRNGTLLRQTNDVDKVYLIKDKYRHLILSPEVLQFFGGWDGVCTVPEFTLDEIPVAADVVTLQNVNTTFNFKKEYDILIDSLRTTLIQNRHLLDEVGKNLKLKNNKLQKRKVMVWTSLVGLAALLLIGLLLGRNSRQKQKLHRQSLEALKAEEELQRKMVLEKERTRIATDMHDDLGAGLSKIRFLSETVQRNIKEKEHQPNLVNIANSSVELVDKFNEIIWAMNEKNNSLEDLLYYIRNYTAKYCEENNLAYKIIIPDLIPSLLISGETRRDIFLTVKEALHNIVKHAAATLVGVQIKFTDLITINIRDNGKGFDWMEVKTAGNGLRNMEHRMKSIHGNLLIENNSGTALTMSIPLPVSGKASLVEN